MPEGHREPSDAEQVTNQSIERVGWLYSGGSRSTSISKIKAKFSGWPKDKQDCLHICGYVLTGRYPTPDSDLWLSFGFCTCPSHFFGIEQHLADTYKRLLNRCTFDEFFAAYKSSKLYPLFAANDLASAFQPLPLIEELLNRSPNGHHSMWDLKHYAVRETDVDLFDSYGPMMIQEFGFSNCDTKEEEQALKAIYRTLFLHTKYSPFDFQKASHRNLISDPQDDDGQRLYSYVSSLVRFPDNLRYSFIMTYHGRMPCACGARHRDCPDRYDLCDDEWELEFNQRLQALQFNST